ncbi:MAG: hypothetical protein WD065_20065 [Planctomycetaceae bacterium]
MLVPLPKIPGRDLDTEMSDAIDNGWPTATPEIHQWVADNRPALERWKAGTEKPDFLWQQPKDLHLSSNIILAESRTLVRLAQLQNSRCLTEQNTKEAWIWCRALLRSSRQIGFHGTVFQRMIGSAYHAVSTMCIMDLAQHPATTEALLQEMLDEVHRVYLQTVPQSVYIQCDYLTYKNLLRDSDAMAEFIKPGKGVTKMDEIQIAFAQKFGYEPRMGFLVFQQYTANILDQIDLPVKDRQPRIGILELFEPDPARRYPPGTLSPSEIENVFLKSILARESLKKLHAYKSVDESCLREESRQYALELWLALQIFERINGNFPDDLSDLVAANIIDSIPLDPFSTTGAAMQYRRDEDTAIVWGIGENYVDDHGAIDKPVGKLPPDIGMRLGDDGVEAKKP